MISTCVGGTAETRNTRNERNTRTPAAAEVSPEPVSMYNDRVMRISKHIYSPLVLVLGLGLLYSQVCNVICAFSNYSAPAPVREAATVEHGGHCHQEKRSSQQGRTSSQKDQPEDHQHRCPAHDSAASILPSETISAVVSHHASQSAAELVSSLDTLFDLAVSGADCGGHFRSPPRPPLFTIIRI